MSTHSEIPNRTVQLEREHRLMLTVDVIQKDDLAHLVPLMRCARLLRGIKVGQGMHTTIPWSKVMRMAARHHAGDVFLDSNYLEEDPVLLGGILSGTLVGSKPVVRGLLTPAMFSVHRQIGPEAIRHAVAMKGASKLILKSVSHSLEAEACRRVYFGKSPAEVLSDTAELALETGADGVMCAATCIPEVRKVASAAELAIIATGIAEPRERHYLPGVSVTARQALEMGADMVAIGRTISHAANPLEKTQEIVDSLN